MPVKEGQGIDGYKNKGGNVDLYEVYSINIFSKTYSSFHDINSVKKEDDYVLDSESLKKQIYHLSNKFNKDVKKLNHITNENGEKTELKNISSKIMVIYLPEEVQSNKKMTEELQKIGQETADKKGVTIIWKYSQKALH